MPHARPKPENDAEQKIIDHIDNAGWHVERIFPDKDTPGWAFSVGFYEKFDVPECIIFGLPLDSMQAIINIIGDRLRDGEKFEMDAPVDDLLNSFPCILKLARPKWVPWFGGAACWYYQKPDVPFMQCFWPDKARAFPWDPAFNEKIIQLQPLLYLDDPRAARAENLLATMGE
ncbi:MAG: DUF4262 domain-containing protein [Planctomycetes bacterium]|nr:DUF4262 domain-containing protein [Planctomycetota bacterium]